MKAIHQNSESIHYKQNKMNIQEEKNLIIYNKKNIEAMPQYFQSKEQAYYNDNINTARIYVGQTNIKNNESKTIQTKSPTYTDTSTGTSIGTGTGTGTGTNTGTNTGTGTGTNTGTNTGTRANTDTDTYGYISKDIDIGGYKKTYTDIRIATPITTHETISAYAPTNENLQFSHQSLDMWNHKINSKETVENVCFENINRMHKQHKYNTNKQVIKNDFLQHSNCYDYNRFKYLDPNEKKTYLQNTAEPQINTYENVTNIENHIYLTKSQQNLCENIQQSLPDAYKQSIYSKSAQNVLSAFQQNITYDLQNQEQQQLEAIIHMQNKQNESENEAEEKENEEEKKKITKEKELENEENKVNEENEETKKQKKQANNEMVEQDNYGNLHRQRKYYLQKNEDSCVFSQNAHENQNNYELRKINENKNCQLGINEQELAAYYTQCAEHNKMEISQMYQLYNDKMQEYIHKPNDINGNNSNMSIQTHNRNYHSNAVKNSEESYNQLELFKPYMQNSTFIMTYENSSALVNTEKDTNNKEKNDESEENLRQKSVDLLNGILKIRTIHAETDSFNIANSLSQHQLQQQDIKQISQHNINQNMINVSNTQEHSITQNADFYSNIPAEINESANKQSFKNTIHSPSVNSTVDMQSRLNDLNGMSRMNYNSLMFQHNQQFNQKQTPGTLGEKEYLNILMNKQYSKKDIKKFMLEPKMCTKMDLDMPEIIDGLTTVLGDGGDTFVKKETIMKYKDAWRLIPGKSLNINQNGNTNQKENEIQLFQQYLDIYNKKTQQMLLNSSFNSLTGRFTLHPPVNDQELYNASNIYNYKDLAAAIPNSYYQPTNSLANDKTLSSTSCPTAINEVNNEQEWNFHGTKQFISTNELRNAQEVKHVKMLNKITGADQINAINNMDSMPMNVNNDSHFSVDIPENTDSLLNATANMSKEKQQQKQLLKKKTAKKTTLPLCGNNMITYNIKSYIAQTVKNYLKGKQTD